MYEEAPEWQLPEPSMFIGAKDYRTKIALPLVQRLKKVIFDMTIRCADALEKVKKYRVKNNNLQAEVNTLAKRIREQQGDISELSHKAQTLEDLRELLGEDKVREMADAASRRRKMEKIDKKHKSRGVAI